MSEGEKNVKIIEKNRKKGWKKRVLFFGAFFGVWCSSALRGWSRRRGGAHSHDFFMLMVLFSPLFTRNLIS